MWEHGLGPRLFPMMDSIKVVPAFCNTLLSNDTLKENLRSKNFKLAVIDLFCHECAAALFHHLGQYDMHNRVIINE